MNDPIVYSSLTIGVVLAPALLFAVLGLASLLGYRLREHVINRLTQSAVVAGLLTSIAILVLMLVDGTRYVPVEIGNWVVIPEQHFHFTVKLVFDRLSVPFVILSFLLCGTVGAFAHVYLHREPGFNRFFVLYAMFLLGMVVTALAGTIETLFAGWELVGLSSALLVGYFHERSAPVRNGQRVWIVYRIADAALLTAAVALHHLTGEGDFSKLLGGAWPDGQAMLTANQALFVGVLLLIAAAGKSALIPFSGWLPRAMEGPTPSSAIFYGALSVHLGAFLLLRVSPLFDLSLPLSILVVCLGLSTALFATLTGRVQTDIKSALSFACMAQLGIIVAEIGLGLRYVALVHIIGHACLRTLQFVRAPSVLLDYNNLENAIGARLASKPAFWRGIVPESQWLWLYRFGLERGYLDAALAKYIALPFIRVFQWCDAAERRWTDFLSGGPSRESDRIRPSADSLEEL